ncbi:hypothetical protein PIB30_102116 [Stylosanthes scabra]|uniref:Uncharacterized protein n=1 Tax=Stylosanthes scabra TaxID=79078 RepID=A0ABU6VXU5_9FABA|nr:hypothetical protein [Stylosanthes scabra]
MVAIEGLGQAVTGPTTCDWNDICQRLLGVVPPMTRMRGSRLSLPWLCDHFHRVLVEGKDSPDYVAQYVRSYIIRLIGGISCPDHSDSVDTLFQCHCPGFLHSRRRGLAYRCQNFPRCGDPRGERLEWGPIAREFSPWGWGWGQNPPEALAGTRAGNPRPRPRIPEN